MFFFSVVPHITDAIQEHVQRVAHQTVTEDGEQPEVIIAQCKRKSRN